MGAALAGCAQQQEVEGQDILLDFPVDDGLYWLQVFHPYGNPYRERGGPENGGIWIGHGNPDSVAGISQGCEPDNPDFWMHVILRKAPDQPVLFDATWHHLDCLRYVLHVDRDSHVTLSRLMGPTAGKPIPPGP